VQQRIGNVCAALPASECSLARTCGVSNPRVPFAAELRWDTVKRASEARIQVSNADLFDPSLDLSGMAQTT
jgi:hypothetical protein